MSRPFGRPSDNARQYDIIIIGAGVAGLAFALRLPPDLRVAILTKSSLGESNTRYAQGGLAAAVGPDDSTGAHFADTMVAGAGLCDPVAVRTLVDGAPAAVRWLIEIGTTFDREGERYALGREGAHSRRRVLHAGGDATGAEIERALVDRLRSDPRIDIHEHAFAHDLIARDGRIGGVIADLGEGQLTRLHAPLTVMAAGGAGQLWATTSNPPGATADGLAMAVRAGAAIADVPFMQFHPTVLALPGIAPFLVSEAVRGEGAYLRDAHGERFMLHEHEHELAELAPRDVVARAIQRQMLRDDADHVSLDLRHLDAEEVARRFPTIAAELKQRGLDLARNLIPIAPAAHYFMGGIVADTYGRTSLPGLLALGEASCTGVHGANRLASNSLLEGLVFGLNAADLIEHDPPRRAAPAAGTTFTTGSAPAGATSAELPSADAVADMRRQVQGTMSRYVSVLRDADGLQRALAVLARLREQLSDDLRPVVAETGRNDCCELDNMLTAATAVAEEALARTESRGAHARADYPDTDPTWDGQHSLFVPGVDSTWRRGTLIDALAPPAMMESVFNG